MNDMRLQQQQQQQQLLQNGHRNSNFSTATIVKKRNNTGGSSFSLSKNEINQKEDANVNKNDLVVKNFNNSTSDDVFQQNSYESQYPEDMIDVQVIAKMQEESNL